MHRLQSDSKEHYAETFSQLAVAGLEISGKEFEQCNFTDCNFTEASFVKCRFVDCTFTLCNLSVMKVAQCQFSAVVFDECKLVGIDWTRATWPRLALATALQFTKCILNDSSFFGLSLDEIMMEECKAHEVDFRGGSFCRANFAHTDFTNCLFNKTNLSGANFAEAVNYDIDIFNNKIDKAIFSRHEALRLLSGLDIELID